MKANIIPALTQLSIDKAASIHQSIHASVSVIISPPVPSEFERVIFFRGARWQWRLQKWWNAMKHERQTQRDMLVVLIHSPANPGNSYHQRETSTRGERGEMTGKQERRLWHIYGNFTLRRGKYSRGNKQSRNMSVTVLKKTADDFDLHPELCLPFSFETKEGGRVTQRTRPRKSAMMNVFTTLADRPLNCGNPLTCEMRCLACAR